MSILHTISFLHTLFSVITLYSFSETVILVAMVCLAVIAVAWIVSRGPIAIKRRHNGKDADSEKQENAGKTFLEDNPRPMSKEQLEEMEEFRLNSVRECLKSLNIRYKEDKDKDDGSYFFRLSFQGGTFFFILRPVDIPSDLIYPHFYSGNELLLDHIRHVANNIAGSLFPQSLFYEFNEKTNEYALNLSANVYVSKKEGLDKEYFMDLLQQFFSCARVVTNEINNFLQEQKEELPYDKEKETHLYARRRYLVKESMLKNEDLPIPTHYNHTEELRLEQVLQLLEDIPDIRCRSLDISGSSALSLHDTERINAFNILDIFPKHPDEAPAILHLSYTLSSDVEDAQKEKMEEKMNTASAIPSHHLLLMLTTEGQTEESRYVRLLVSGYSDTNGQMPHYLPERRAPFCKELHFSICDKTPDKKLIEFDYLWQDAKDKIREGKQKDLSQEQQLIVGTEDDQTAYWLYWGEHYYLNKESARAILYLENAFQRMEKKFTELTGKEQENFYQLRFLLGDSYRRLGNFKMANYYLQPTEACNNVEQSVSYIKNLMEGEDFRAYEYVEGILANFEEQRKNPDYEPTPILEPFYQFLRRTQVLLILRKGEIIRAEKILVSMLGEEENRNYAVGLLQKIQKKLHKNMPHHAGNTTENGTSSPDNTETVY